MKRLQELLASNPATWVVLLMLAASAAQAQETPPPPPDADAAEDEAAEAEVLDIPAGEKWDATFGISVKYGFWIPVQVRVADEPKINDATDSYTGIDIGLRWFASERISVIGRVFQGGLEFDPDEIGQFSGISPALSTDSLIDLKGAEVGLHVALSSLENAGSYLRPYLTLGLGLTDWTVSQDGSGGEPHVIQVEALEGSAAHILFGAGVDYPLGKSLWLELDWSWRAFLTSDKEKFNLDTARWGATHSWQLGPALVLRF